MPCPPYNPLGNPPHGGGGHGGGGHGGGGHHGGGGGGRIPARVISRGGRGWGWGPSVIPAMSTCSTWGDPVALTPALSVLGASLMSGPNPPPANAYHNGVLYLFTLEPSGLTARPCATLFGAVSAAPPGVAGDPGDIALGGVIGAVGMGVFGALVGALGALVFNRKKVRTAASVGAVVGGVYGAARGAKSAYDLNHT